MIRRARDWHLRIYHAIGDIDDAPISATLFLSLIQKTAILFRGTSMRSSSKVNSAWPQTCTKNADFNELPPLLVIQTRSFTQMNIFSIPHCQLDSQTTGSSSNNSKKYIASHTTRFTNSGPNCQGKC